MDHLSINKRRRWELGAMLTLGLVIVTAGVAIAFSYSSAMGWGLLVGVAIVVAFTTLLFSALGRQYR